MTLKQLEVFLAVAETRSFSKGAERSCITQSTASQHILALEDELQIRLFDRGRGGVHLTEAGKLFFERADRILAECENSRLAISRFRGMEDVVLKVGASNIPATCLIPGMLSRFQEACPRVRLEVMQGDSRWVARQLVEETIELGFTGARSDDERLQFEPIGEDSVICAVSPCMAESAGYGLSQSELCQVPLVVREQGSGTQQAVYEALADAGIRREALRTVAVLGSNEAVRRAALNGTGYAFVSSISVAEDIARGVLVTVTIPGLSITRKFYAARRAGRELSPAAAALWQLMLA
ncbi:selenium metabolism-associated LysR family transcriptional regulator [Geobacter sp. SVR]|uniref:selenium metabolism-associated LysR family transcriptional regulator n=1 Tax=Geobacter sp. SVR TaxID=2495594 RepID=UPI00143F0302|nr:selenium metabolism-associated LysR family transcriptional regulator [Geobacter sp. SVR]BCS53817.1 LysR family transcriptional regulator [Geobacter sp. SVR]GCF85674.1 LysR family transcriptional regulator [Geobacter sp. SVR]